MLTNRKHIPLPMAVWLAAQDGYDLEFHPEVISATELLLPLRSLVLSRRTERRIVQDIDDLVPSRLGTATHTAMENAWLNHYAAAMANLGYSDEVIASIKINPDVVNPGDVPVYLEKRTNRKLLDYTISGKFDIVINGELHDLKTTRTFAWISGSNDREYQLQGSIYRWLNPDLITEDYLTINYLFTDWNVNRAMSENDYPTNRCMSKKFPLLSLKDIETFMVDKLAQFKKYETAPQEELPKCSTKELWQEHPRWAYYKSPNNMKRATKLFDLERDANLFNQLNGSKGVVVKREGEPRRCNYCAARNYCLQAQDFELAGLLNKQETYP